MGQQKNRGIIGILTGGGDVPGLNPAIRAVTIRALREGYKVIGIKRGWGGLIDIVRDPQYDNSGNFFELTEEIVNKAGRTGGTFLHTSRTRASHVPKANVPKHLQDKYSDDINDLTPEVLKNLEFMGIDYLIPIGGDDTLSYAVRLSKESVKVVAIPKTMDNDLDITDHCPGFGSAARYAGEAACELALDASGLPIHVVVLELMGRNAGWVTAASALAARATNCEVLTYLPEKPVDEDKMLADIETAWAKGHGLLVTVSEGICGMDGKPLASTGIVDGFGHTIPGGTAQHVTDNIIQKLNIKSRAEKPGLLGRAAIPYASRVDQVEAYAVGRKAVEAALAGETDYMVAIDAHRGGAYSFDLFLTPLSQVANVEKKFPPEWIIDGNKIDDRFFDYAMPLMMDKMPDYAILR